MATEVATPRTGVPARHRALPGRRIAGHRETSKSIAWLRRHALSIPIVGALLALAAIVLGTGIGGYPQLADDEGTYVSQAWSILADGSLAHYTYWYDHPPLGWIQLAVASLVTHPIGSTVGAVGDARALMLIPALASAALLYVLARRLGVSRAFAAVAVLLFVLSPLTVTWLRQIYLDNIATPWILGAFVLAASPRRRLWAYAGSGLCIAVALLTKETSLLVLPGLLLQFRQDLDRRTRAFCTAAFASLLALFALGYPLYALLKGELLPGHGHVSLYEAVRWQLFDRQSTGSALQAGSQSRGLVQGWLGTDAWLIALGAGASVIALALRRLRPVAVTLLVLIAGALRPGYLPEPFVIVMLPFCALLVAGVLDALARTAGGRLPRPRAGVALVSAAAVAALAVVLAPSWQRGDSWAMSQDVNSAQPAAASWAAAHIDHRARVLVDDDYYVDLVSAGFKPRLGAVWFFKLDFTTNLDPSVERALPRGWRSFDYVISSPVIRSSLAGRPGAMQQVRLALAHSRTIRTFGSGPQRVEIRRVVGGGSGLLPRPHRHRHRERVR